MITSGATISGAPSALHQDAPRRCNSLGAAYWSRWWIRASIGTRSTLGTATITTPRSRPTPPTSIRMPPGSDAVHIHEQLRRLERLLQAVEQAADIAGIIATPIIDEYFAGHVRRHA